MFCRCDGQTVVKFAQNSVRNNSLRLRVIGLLFHILSKVQRLNFTSVVFEFLPTINEAGNAIASVRLSVRPLISTPSSEPTDR